MDTAEVRGAWTGWPDDRRQRTSEGLLPTLRRCISSRGRVPSEYSKSLMNGMYQFFDCDLDPLHEGQAEHMLADLLEGLDEDVCVDLWLRVLIGDHDQSLALV